MDEPESEPLLTSAKRVIVAALRLLKAGLAVVGAACFAVSGIGASLTWNEWVIWTTFAAGFILTGAGSWYELKRRRPYMRKLRAQRDEFSKQVSDLEVKCQDLDRRLRLRSLDLIKVVEILLREMAESLNMYVVDTRFSVYRKGSDCFVLIGRVSRGPFSEVGREEYPDNQGFISEVWAGHMDRKKVAFPESRRDWEEMQVETYRL